MIEYSAERRNNALNEFITPRELALRMAQLSYEFLQDTDRVSVLNVIDGGANTGRFGSAVRQVYKDAWITGVELMKMPTKPLVYNEYFDNTDFLNFWPNKSYDLAIGNPPFTVNNEPTAENFARKNIYLLREGGWSIQLLRTNFLHSAERVAFWQEYPAKYVYILVRRPSFYKQDPREEMFGKANTNAHDYSVFVWQKGWQGEPTLRWLEWDYEKEEPEYYQIPLPEVFSA